jgi:hypothetical protein
MKISYRELSKLEFNLNYYNFIIEFIVEMVGKECLFIK